MGQVVVGKHIQVIRVNLAVLKVANHNLVVEERLAVGAMADVLTVGKPGALMPCACGHVKHPCLLGARERQHVKGMAILLIGKGNRIRDVAITLDSKLNRVGGDTLARIAVSPEYDALASGIRPQPEQRVVHLGDREGRRAANLVDCALDPRQRERCVACVVPNFNRLGAKQPHLAVVDKKRHQIVRHTFGAGKRQRVNLRAVKQLRRPESLRIRLLEHKIAIQKADRHRAWKVHVRDFGVRFSCRVVDKPFRVGRDKQLCAVIHH